MPYTKNNPPDAIKNLPKGAQSIWIRTFNGLLNDGKSENQARQAAWRNVKLKYKKEGDNWVKKSNSQESFKLHITSPSRFIRLAESENDSEESKKGVYAIIKAGWSSNGFYYSEDVLPQLVPFIEGKPMLFADHIEPKIKKDKMFGNELSKAVAIAEKVWFNEESKEVQVVLNPLQNGNHWIYEASQKYPEHIGLSIDAYGKVKVGEAEGKKGKLVESFTGYDETDFVYRPAAGGKFLSLTEATLEEDQSIEFDLEEAIKDFKDYVDKREKKSTFFMLGNHLIDFLYEVIVWDPESTADEKQQIFENALNQFIEKIKEIDPVNLFNAQINNNNNHNDELTNLAIKLKEEKMLTSDEVKKALEGVTPEVLSSVAPNLVESIIKNHQESAKSEETSKKVTKLEKEVNELLEKVKNLDEENKKLKTDLEEKDAELKKFQEAEKLSEFEAQLDEVIKEAEIDPVYITDTFKETLMESQDIEKAKKLIEDRKSIVADKSGFDNGKEPTMEGEDNTKEEGVMSDDELVKDIKS